jgi:hypothetical protein
MELGMNRLAVIVPTSFVLAAAVLWDPPPQPLLADPAPSELAESAPEAAKPDIRLASYSVKVGEERPRLPPMGEAEASARWDRMQGWMRCAQGARCQLPENDPREAHFTVRDALLKEGEWFLEHSSAPEQEKHSRNAAFLLLEFPDEEVQSMAIKWILTLPPDVASLSKIRENLINMVDPELARLTMMELSRHRGLPSEREMTDLVEDLLFEGSIFASREVARSVDLVVTEANRGRVERWMSELPPKSAKIRLMKESLGF